jgi:hypothetical protein
MRNKVEGCMRVSSKHWSPTWMALTGKINLVPKILEQVEAGVTIIFMDDNDDDDNNNDDDVMIVEEVNSAALPPKLKRSMKIQKKRGIDITGVSPKSPD